MATGKPTPEQIEKRVQIIRKALEAFVEKAVDETVDIPSCRVCMESTWTNDNRLIQPCMCTGSIRWIHMQCLETWRINHPEVCTTCRFTYRRSPLSWDMCPSLVRITCRLILWALSVFMTFCFVVHGVDLVVVVDEVITLFLLYRQTIVWTIWWVSAYRITQKVRTRYHKMYDVLDLSRSQHTTDNPPFSVYLLDRTHPKWRATGNKRDKGAMVVFLCRMWSVCLVWLVHVSIRDSSLHIGSPHTNLLIEIRSE